MVFIYFFFFIQKKFSQTFNSLDLWLSLLSYSRRILFNPLNAWPPRGGQNEYPLERRNRPGAVRLILPKFGLIWT